MIVGTQKAVPIITAKIMKKGNKIHLYEKVKKIKPRFCFGLKMRGDIGNPLFPEMKSAGHVVLNLCVRKKMRY